MFFEKIVINRHDTSLTKCRFPAVFDETPQVFVSMFQAERSEPFLCLTGSTDALVEVDGDPPQFVVQAEVSNFLEPR